MTTEHIAAAMERVQTGAAAPARDGPARRRAGDGPLARRHARRRRATRNGTAGADRHADRARRHRRPGHAGLAVPRRPRVVRDDVDRDDGGGARHRARPRSRCSVSSRSDTRGLLGMADERGEPVGAGPSDVRDVGAHRRARRRARAAARAGRGRLPLLADPERGRARDADRAAHRRRRRLTAMDALSETLRVVRLVGAIFIQGRFTAPWCYQSPTRRRRRAGPRAERRARRDLPPDHRGRVLRRDRRRAAGAPDRRRRDPLPAGRRAPDDVAARPAAGHGRRASSEVLARRPRQIAYGGGGATTRLVCGYLACDARLAQDAARRLAAARARQRARLERRHLARGVGALRARPRRARRGPAAPACSPSSPRCSSSRCCACT